MPPKKQSSPKKTASKGAKKSPKEGQPENSYDEKQLKRKPYSK